MVEWAGEREFIAQNKESLDIHVFNFSYLHIYDWFSGITSQESLDLLTSLSIISGWVKNNTVPS